MKRPPSPHHRLVRGLSQHRVGSVLSVSLPQQGRHSPHVPCHPRCSSSPWVSSAIRSPDLHEEDRTILSSVLGLRADCPSGEMSCHPGFHLWLYVYWLASSLKRAHCTGGEAEAERQKDVPLSEYEVSSIFGLPGLVSSRPLFSIYGNSNNQKMPGVVGPMITLGSSGFEKSVGTSVGWGLALPWAVV